MLLSTLKLSNRDARAGRGFTLVELMITVAIIAIISAIAYPNYTRYVMRSNRTDATAALLRLAAAQEKFYLQNNTYTTTITNVGSANSEHGYYTITIDTGNATTFTASATAPTGSRQRNDTDCRTFTITAAGVKGASKADTTANDAACWR
jgi:type IV pilus assembly protein PilE